MKFLFEVILLGVISLHLVASETKSEIYSLDSDSVDQYWHEFKIKHSKLFRESTLESKRRKIFEKNLKRINEHNKKFNNKTESYTLGITKFADMTFQEFMEFVTRYSKNEIKKSKRSAIIIQTYKYSSNQSLPTSVDWRTKGYVNPIQDQGTCGACWTFSTVAALEGQYFKAKNKLVKLSEQNLVDCVNTFLYNSKGTASDGCNGSDGNTALTYIFKNKGINYANTYPYSSGTSGKWSGKCKYSRTNNKVQITGYVIIPSGNEVALTSAIANIGPIRASVYVSDKFQLYTSGVFTDASTCPKATTELNHEVTLVGYGTLNNKAHYIVRNQWGTSWGVNGYMYFARNNKNQCGIATDSSYPLVV